MAKWTTCDRCGSDEHYMEDCPEVDNDDWDDES